MAPTPPSRADLQSQAAGALAEARDLVGKSKVNEAIAVLDAFSEGCSDASLRKEADLMRVSLEIAMRSALLVQLADVERRAGPVPPGGRVSGGESQTRSQTEVLRAQYDITVRLARSLARRDLLHEALAIIEDFEKVCDEPSMLRSLDYMKIAYQARADQLAEDAHKSDVGRLRALAREGRYDEALQLIAEFEQTWTDPAQIRDLTYMKIAYQAGKTEADSNRYKSTVNRARELARQGMYMDALRTVLSYEAVCTNPEYLSELQPLVAAYSALLGE
jgi:hypothetical protein